MENVKEPFQIDVFKILNALWNKIIIICIVTLICGVGGFCYAKFLIQPLYKSDISIYVNNSSIDLSDTVSSITSSNISASRSLVSTYTAVLKSRDTLKEIISKANLDYTPSQLKSMISASSIEETEVLQIIVSSPDPDEAEKIAQTITEVLPDRINDIIDGSSARIVDYAEKPTVSYYPNCSKYAVYGLSIGFVAVCAIIIIMSIVDDSVKSEEDITANFDIPVLASIPDLDEKDHSSKYKYYYSKYSYKK